MAPPRLASTRLTLLLITLPLGACSIAEAASRAGQDLAVPIGEELGGIELPWSTPPAQTPEPLDLDEVCAGWTPEPSPATTGSRSPPELTVAPASSAPSRPSAKRRPVARPAHHLPGPRTSAERRSTSGGGSRSPSVKIEVNWKKAGKRARRAVAEELERRGSTAGGGGGGTGGKKRP